MTEQRLRVEVPGKLVLVGEYAVVDGAPAVVLAIDHGVACDVLPGGHGVRILVPGGDDRFVRAALMDASAAEYRFSDHTPVRLPRPGDKPGFGGSASACVAACLAAGREATDAFAIHRAVQGGGSGVDVGAAIAGGCVRFQQDRWTALPAPRPVVIWSGASARTGPRVQRYRAWPGRAAFILRSTEIVDLFAEDPVRALEEDGDLLESMAKQAEVDYQTPALDRVRELAREVGGAAKPSGAGGGDCAVALFPDPERRRHFQSACEHAGLLCIPSEVAPGARRVAWPLAPSR